ncbi:MAG TPA: phosphohydrolase, partial [Planctomycetaceae bacterium]|nr:phosphohydrolase [Planctomycetaceae bacterium]
GYPLGLEGNEIPKLAQIIAMADAYDAMTSSRPYRQGMSQEVVVNEIQRCSGKQWSDELVWAFIKTLK